MRIIPRRRNFGKRLDRISMKLSIILLIGIMVIFSLTGFFIYYQTKKIIVNKIEQNLTTQSSAIAGQINSLFEQFGILVKQMTTNQDIISFLKSASSQSEAISSPLYGEMVATLNAIADMDSRLSLVWISSNKGNFFIANKSVVSNPNFQVESRRWYAPAMKAGGVSYSPLYIDSVTGKLIMSVVHKIQIRGETLGFVAVDLQLDSLPEFMKSCEIHQSGYTFLLTNDGTMIYHPDPALVLKKMMPSVSNDLYPVANEMLEKKKGLGLYKVNGSLEYVGFAPVGSTDLSVAFSTPAKKALAELDRYGTLIIIYFIVAIIILVLITYIVLAYYLRRVPYLSGVIKKLSTGEAIINQNDYAIIVVDPDFNITYFSKTAEKMLGYTSKELINRENLLIFHDPQDIKDFAAALSEEYGQTFPPDLSLFQHMFLDGQLSYDVERIYVHKDGTRIPVSVNVNKMLDHNENVIGYIRICRDISEQKRTQAELVQAKKEAEEANQAKSIFLATMSHELRTPLNGIIGLSHLVQKTEMTPIQKDYLNKILSSSQALLRIINEILDFSKIEAGKLEMEETEFNLYELFRKLSDMLSVFIGKKQLEIILDTPSDWPERILGDPLRLEQVLLNLCSNAIKFTEKGHVIIRANTVKANGEQLTVHFSIIDSGIGISEQQLDKLFEPFTQADGSTSRKYGGTGLGLVICKNLVAFMNGNLEAQSVLGVGSIFSFALPFRTIPSAHKQSFQLPAFDLDHRRFLLVEDHEYTRESIETMLEDMNFAVTSVSSWKEAFEILEHSKLSFTAAALDMEAPDMYGEDTWLHMLSLLNNSHTQTILMTTTYGREAILNLPESHHPNAIHIKPINRLTLHQTLWALLDHQRFNIDGALSSRQEAAVSQEPIARVLLAEDHEINQQVAAELLQSRGFDVGVAANGHEVLQALQESKWDFILMDIQMPEMDGLEATRRIRNMLGYEQLPIIALTAHMTKRDREIFLQAGMNDVISKPICIEEMFTVIGKWFDMNQMQPIQTRHIEVLNSQIQQFLKASGIHTEQALQRLDGKAHIFIKMLTTFQQNYEKFMEQLLQAIERQEFELVSRMVHTLKGTAGNLSAHPLFMAADELEQSLIRKSPEDELQQKILAVQQQLNRVLEALQILS